VPATPHTVPVHVRNARIQLAATALTNLGVGSILVGMITPVVRGEGNVWSVTGWLAVGMIFVSVARWLLGRLR
jgi:hypothetical protein